MKRVTKNTILKCGQKTFEPILIDGVVHWYTEYLGEHRKTICLATKDPKKYCNGTYLYSDKDPGTGKVFAVVAQSSYVHEGIPVISIHGYVEKLAWEAVHNGNIKDEKQQVCGFTGWVDGYYSSPYKYTIEDIQKAYRAGHEDRGLGFGNKGNFLNRLEEIDTIRQIDVDEDWNIIRFS